MTILGVSNHSRNAKCYGFALFGLPSEQINNKKCGDKREKYGSITCLFL